MEAGAAIEPFVAVSWDKALDLVAGELLRGQGCYGNCSDFQRLLRLGVGRLFHNARTQLHRFLNEFGG